MQQRRLRLGDILDDYCPRERRITNHAVVAKIDDEVRQTRCLTCDTEHEYRQGKAPTLRKKKDNVSAAYREVLAEVTKGAPGAAPAEPEPAPAAGEAPANPGAEAANAAPEAAVEAAPEPEASATELAASPEAGPADADGPRQVEPADAAEGPEAKEGRVHRRLIRATLPRPDNQAVTRPIPQFTMRQPTGRAAKFRPSPGRGPRPVAGARAGAAGAGRGFPTRGGAPHAGRPVRAEAQRSRGAHPPRPGKKHSK